MPAKLYLVAIVYNNWIAVKTSTVLRKETFAMNIDIVRAWKDATYRTSLSAEEQAQLPANPAGAVELSDAELATVHGAQITPGATAAAPENANNVRVDTAGVLCLHTVQLTIGIGVLPVLSPSTQNAACY